MALPGEVCEQPCKAERAEVSGCAVFRAMGDIVDEMDSHRRKSFALLTRKGADGRAELDNGEHASSMRASRSFSKVALGFPASQDTAAI